MTIKSAKQSRRVFMSSAVTSIASVGSVVTVPAAAATSLAGHGDTKDPFLIALAAWRGAYDEWLASLDAVGELEDKINDDSMRDHARVQFGIVHFTDDNGIARARPQWLTSHEQIAELQVPAAIRRMLHLGLKRDAAWLDAAQEKNGLKAARQREERAAEEEKRLLCAACYVVPTTLAGALALTRFVREQVHCEAGEPSGDDGEAATKQSLLTLEHSLAVLASDGPAAFC